MKSKKILIGVFVIALVGLPLILSLNQKRQDARSRASASTSLYFTPSTTESSPVEAKIGDILSFDVMINPGTNLPSVVKLEMLFDPAKIQVGQTSFVANLAAFPTTLEGPVLNNGNLALSLSIGSDTTKAIQTVTKVGTLTVKVTESSGDAPTKISFGANTMVLSLGASDYSNENILSTTSPAYIHVPAAPTETPTQIPSETPIPTLTETPTQTPTEALTTLSATVFHHGVGNSGDNANPTDSDLSNKSPLHTQINATAFIYDAQNQFVTSSSGNLIYDAQKGNFSGDISLDKPISQGLYTVLIQTAQHLRRLIPGIQTLVSQQKNILPEVSLVTGDINNDNSLNILDYNFILNCYSDLEPPKSCPNADKISSDLNDDGFVNQIDYNLFLRELSTQSGN